MIKKFITGGTVALVIFGVVRGLVEVIFEGILPAVEALVISGPLDKTFLILTLVVFLIGGILYTIYNSTWEDMG
jgi:hypothetical protein